MKNALAIAAVLAAGTAAQAAPVDTSLWSEERAPSTNNLSSGSWSSLGGTSAYRGGNDDASLVSDFTLSGDFSYSGTMQSVGNDDDNMGIVFGWSDYQNNYRMGWESRALNGGYGDQGSPVQRGFWVVRESGGTKTVLANDSNLVYTRGTTYNFAVSRTGNDISYSLTLGTTTLASGTVADATFLSGKVGVYVESQDARFENLAAAETSAVPVPASLPLLLAGFGGLAALRRRG